MCLAIFIFTYYCHYARSSLLKIFLWGKIVSTPVCVLRSEFSDDVTAQVQKLVHVHVDSYSCTMLASQRESYSWTLNHSYHTACERSSLLLWTLAQRTSTCTCESIKLRAPTSSQAEYFKPLIRFSVLDLLCWECLTGQSDLLNNLDQWACEYGSGLKGAGLRSCSNI